MPNLLQVIRDQDMMRWNNVASDIGFRDINEIASRLSPTDVIRLATKFSNQPLIVIEKECLSQIHRHVTTSNKELGGLLMGQVHTNPIGDQANIILVKEPIASVVFESTSVSLRMDSDIWNTARVKIADGLIVVGWYHSHPNLGAFFSGTDRHNQKNSFYHTYSVGYVIDPYRHDQKWFIGQSAEEVPDDRVILKG